MLMLRPAAWIYGLVMQVRNALFDKGLLRSRSFGMPVIGVGNLTVGGTGKTPHTEYLVRLLKEHTRVAVLSRGYGRNTRGFRMADATSSAADIGDEPCQIRRKHPDITVCVNEDRCDGIERLSDLLDPPFTLLLDDAFQHRYVRPGLQILLTDFHRLYTRDRLLPEGRLRERASGAARADILLVTKCPPTLSRSEAEAIRRELRPAPHQALFFTTTAYAPPQPIFGSALPEGPEGKDVLAITGIARPEPLLQRLREGGNRVSVLRFRDHHNFGPADAKRMNKAFAALPETAWVVTTEKDAERLRLIEPLLDMRLRQALLSLPVEVRFLFGEGEAFDKIILDYVSPNL